MLNGPVTSHTVAMGLGDGEQIWRRAKRLCRSLLTPRFRQEAVREHQLSKHLWLIICDHQRSLQSICPSNTAFHQRISSREFPIPIKVGKRRVWRLCPQLCHSAKFGERLLRAQSGRIEIASFASAATESTEDISCIAARKAAVRSRRSENWVCYDRVADIANFYPPLRC